MRSSSKPESQPSNKRPSQKQPNQNTPSPEIKKIDGMYEQAGLVRSMRGKAGGVTTRARMRATTPEELRRAAPEPRVAANGVEWLAMEAWAGKGRAGIPWLWHGFSTRRGGLSRCYCAEDAAGELNLGFTAADTAETVAANRRLLAEAITGDAATPLMTVKQFHSNVLVVSSQVSNARAFDKIRTDAPPHGRGPVRGGPGAGMPGAGCEAAGQSASKGLRADGLMTDEPGVLLGIQTADCIPVLVADRKRRVVAAFHAGWRGTAKRIVEMGVGRMRLEYGSRPEDLTAAIGPGIGACCYSVGDEVMNEFESQFAYARELFHEVDSADEVRRRYPMLFLTQRAPGHSPMGPFLHVDLVEANRRQLLDAGLKAAAIHVVGGCTSCDRELFFSHRASQGHAGRMLSVIGIKQGLRD
jgi:YfiH family protein